MDSFTKELGLHSGKDKLGSAYLYRDFKTDVFEIGASLANEGTNELPPIAREAALRKKLSTWNRSNYKNKMKSMIREATREARSNGLIEHTPEWEKKQRSKPKKKKRK